MTDLTGQVLGRRYRVDRSVGHGGMARVYKVWDNQRAVFLALKVLEETLAADPTFLNRFEQEAKILERLQHPNIVRIYGLEKSGGQAFILMDYIDGLTLRQEIKISPDGMQPERISQILQPVCAGLHYAHQQGMVHCDIKPGNIMVHRNGTVYLTDFGIARVQGSSNAHAPASAGTLHYMAPEQMRGEPPTPAADIYALGVVLYEMLTGGARPFQEPSNKVSKTAARDAMLAEKTRPTPPSPRNHCSNISPEIEAVVMRCLQPDPRFRYASTLDLLNAWEAAVRGDPAEGEINTLVDTTGSGGSSAPRRWQDFFTRRVLAGAAVFALVAALAVTLASAWSRAQTGPQELTPGAPTAQQGTIAASGAKTDVRSALSAVGETTTPTLAPAVTATPAEAVEPSAAPLPTATPFGGGPGDEGRIAFASDRADGDTPQIWVIQATGRERKQVTNAPKGACQPTWSPDGSKIAYVTPCTGPRETYPGSDIEIVDLTTREVTPLELPGGGFDPDWSPDGSTIAYTRLDVLTNHLDIYAVNLQTNKVIALMERGTKNAYPAWSPDGRHLAFTSQVQGVDEIWQMQADGSSQEELTQAGTLKYFTQPAWSPDGQWIVATMKDYSSGKAMVLVRFERRNPRGGEQLILPDTDQLQDGTFSPDGRWVLYWTYLEMNNMEALMVNLETGEIVNLSDHKARDFHPVWNR